MLSVILQNYYNQSIYFQGSFFQLLGLKQDKFILVQLE